VSLQDVIFFHQFLALVLKEHILSSQNIKI
jgi:hypothetical protein